VASNALDPWRALADELDPWAALADELGGAAPATAAPPQKPQGTGPRAQAIASQLAAEEAMQGVQQPQDALAPGLEESPLAPIRRPSAQEFNQQAASSATQGLAELPAGVLDSIAIAQSWLDKSFGVKGAKPADQQTAHKFAQGVRDLALQLVPHAPEETGLQDSFLASKLPGALGQGVGFIGAGAAGQLAKIPSMLSAAALGGAQNAQAQFWEALGESGDEEEAYTAFGLGMLVGATEAKGLGGLLSRLSKRTGGALTRAMAGAMREGVEEGAQEGIQTVLNNAIAHYTYDDEREFLANAVEGATLGMLSGGILGGVLNAATVPSLGASEKSEEQVTTQPSSQPGIDGAQLAPEDGGEALPSLTEEATPPIDLTGDSDLSFAEQEELASTIDPVEDASLRSVYELGRKVREAAGDEEPSRSFYEGWALSPIEGLPTFDDFTRWDRSAAEGAFEDAALKGEPPPSMTVGMRYGRAPETERSYNTREDVPELGTSMASVAHPDFSDYVWYPISHGDLGDPHYYSGYVIQHERGGDNEPLMVGLSEITQEEYERQSAAPNAEQEEALAEQADPGEEVLSPVTEEAAPEAAPLVKLPDDSEARKSDQPISDETRSKLVSLMEETKPLRDKQTQLVKEWREEQTGRVLGQKQSSGSARARLQGMTGELAGGAPVVAMENIEDRFEEPELEEIAGHFMEHQLAEDMSPQEHSGLWIDMEKLMRYGEIPSPGALEKLSRIFGEDFGRAVGGGKGSSGVGRRLLWEALNTPRAIKSSFDLSAVGRQGLSLGIMHPTAAARAFGAQMRALASEEYSEALNRKLRTSYMGRVFRRSGGDITSSVSSSPTQREEAFMSTWLQRLGDAELSGAGKLLLPLKLIGKGVNASDRAYTTYLNKLRVETFGYWANQYLEEGLDPESNKREFRQLARWINSLSGRGRAGIFEGDAWNALLWSPKFTTSRFEAPARSLALAMQTSDPVAMKAGWRGLIAHVSAALSLAALVKVAADAFDEEDMEVELDWRSSDFMKIRKGNTRIDMAAGYGPPARLVAAWLTGERKNILSGKTEKTNPLISTAYFLRNKLAPVPSAVVSERLGTDPTGAEPTAGSTAVGLIQPMILETFAEVMDEHGAAGLGYLIPDILGFGTSVHEYDSEKGEGSSSRSYHYNHLEDALRRGDKEKAEEAWKALMSDDFATKSAKTPAKRRQLIRSTMDRRGVGTKLLEGFKVKK
jgi:hypothetical protein